MIILGIQGYSVNLKTNCQLLKVVLEYLVCKMEYTTFKHTNGNLPGIVRKTKGGYSRPIVSKKFVGKQRSNFSAEITNILKAWLFENVDYPYPSNNIKSELCETTGIGMGSINNWFTNARRRYLQKE